MTASAAPEGANDGGHDGTTGPLPLVPCPACNGKGEHTVASPAFLKPWLVVGRPRKSTVVCGLCAGGKQVTRAQVLNYVAQRRAPKWVQGVGIVGLGAGALLAMAGHTIPGLLVAVFATLASLWWSVG